MAINIPFIYELPSDGSDVGRVYARLYWASDGRDDLMFSWCDKTGCYVYCDVTDKGRIKFRYLTAPGYTHKRSKVGNMVLSCDDLLDITDKVIKKEKEMANVNYIGGEYNVVKVTYDIDADRENMIGSYNFKIDAGMEVSVGDMLVVEASNGFGLVRVTEYIPKGLDTKTIKEFNKATAWVVDKVDESAQNYRREASERKKFIMKQLQERKEAMEEVAIFALLAEKDPTAAKLLEELESLK